MKRLALPLLSLACLPLMTACPGNDTTDDEVGDTGTGTESTGTDDSSTTDPTTESTDDDTSTTDPTTESTEDTSTTDPTTDTTDTSTDTSTDTTTEGPGEAMLRVLHLGLDAPAVDVFLDDSLEPAVAGLEFQSGTDYLAIPAGLHSVKVAPAGAGPDMAVLVVDGLDLMDGVKYSAVAYDYLANLSALALVDDDQGIDPANTRLQVSHTAPDVGQVDVWALTDPPVLLLENVDFGATASVDVPAGAVDVGVDANDDMVPDLIYSVPDLGGGTFVDVYAVNEAGGSPVFLLAHLPDGTTARLDANCGNGMIDALETCDGADLGGQTCAGLGYDGGELSCNASCDAFVEDACTSGPWGEDFEGGAVLPPEWVFGGNAPWFGSGTSVHAGLFAGETGNIADSQTSYMEVNLNFPANGTVQFWYRVSTEANYDYLRFFVDGVQQTQWAGNVPWTQSAVYNIPAGNHTLRWLYFKDGSVSSNLDTVWVDDIVTSNATLP